MPPVAAAAIGLALLLDAVAREFPERIHPVVWFGAVLERIDRPWRRPRLVGGLAAVGLPLGAALLVAGVTAMAAHGHPAVGGLVAGVVLFATTSRRLLLDVATAVVGETDRAPATARERLPALVGRDPGGLTPGQTRSAAVESAAENLADGLVAPLLAFVAFAWALPLAAGAAAWVKAVNTGDSMLGYRSKPVGWGFARLDDAVVWLPARLSAVLLAVVARDLGAVGRARRWAREPPSPNSGWPMATLAVVLDCRLEKPGGYVLNPTRPLPTNADARRGIRIVGVAGLVAFVGGAVVAWY